MFYELQNVIYETKQFGPLILSAEILGNPIAEILGNGEKISAIESLDCRDSKGLTYGHNIPD